MKQSALVKLLAFCALHIFQILKAMEKCNLLNSTEEFIICHFVVNAFSQFSFLHY